MAASSTSRARWLRRSGATTWARWRLRKSSCECGFPHQKPVSFVNESPRAGSSRRNLARRTPSDTQCWCHEKTRRKSEDDSHSERRTTATARRTKTLLRFGMAFMSKSESSPPTQIRTTRTVFMMFPGRRACVIQMGVLRLCVCVCEQCVCVSCACV